METGSIDLVLTDPPYMINTKSAGGKIDPWADYVNAAFWYAEWIKQARRVLKPTGSLWSFLNWRSFVTFQKASAMLEWPIESVLVWDKGILGPGGIKGLRPSYELIAIWAMPEFAIEDRSLADIQRFKWQTTKPTGHPAEKPVSLAKWIIEHSTREGDTVLDMFMGSGTTGEACVVTKRNFIGMELSERYFEMAQRRIGQAIENGDQIELVFDEEEERENENQTNEAPDHQSAAEAGRVPKDQQEVLVDVEDLREAKQ